MWSRIMLAYLALAFAAFSWEAAQATAQCSSDMEACSSNQLEAATAGPAALQVREVKRKLAIRTAAKGVGQDITKSKRAAAASHAAAAQWRATAMRRARVERVALKKNYAQRSWLAHSKARESIQEAVRSAFGGSKPKGNTGKKNHKNHTGNGTEQRPPARGNGTHGPPPTGPPAGNTTCRECSGGCISEGECYRESPIDGGPATEGLCKEYFLVWCPGNNSLPPLTTPLPGVEPPWTTPLPGGAPPMANCSDCPGGCMHEGNCFYGAPWGENASEALCHQHGGEMCVGAAPNPLPTFCATPASFIPDASVYGECDFEGLRPTPAACRAAGCYSYPEETDEGMYDGCHCPVKASCVAMTNASWRDVSCRQFSTFWEVLAIRRASAQGSCEGVTDSGGVPLAQSVAYFTEMCCSDSPKNICKPDMEYPNPCKDTHDFKAEALLHEWCQFNEVHPDAQSCSAAGCYPYEDYDYDTGLPVDQCSCDNADSCTRLGGLPGGASCGDAVKHIVEEERRAIDDAKEGGTCEGVVMPWQESLEQWLEPIAQKCCKSYPATACAPDAAAVTVCKNKQDLDAEAIVHEGCDFSGPVSKDACEQAGCHHWEEEHDGHVHEGCHCEDRSACEDLNGTYFAETCGQQESRYDLQTRQSLQKVGKGESCDEIYMPWEEPASQFVRDQGNRCCKSSPQSVCEPNATLLTPCKSDEDFNSSAFAEEHCDYHGAGPEDQECEEQGFEHCGTKQACDHYGGHYVQHTCAEEARHWDAGGHGFKFAKEQGSCEGVNTEWGEPLMQAMYHYASQCCNNFPESACGTLEEPDWDHPEDDPEDDHDEDDHHD